MIVTFALLAVIAGISLSLQKAVNARLGERLGLMESSFANHAVGAVIAAALLVVGIRTGTFVTTGVPWYLFMGGCIGLIMIVLINYAFPIIGATATLICMILSQLSSSVIVDHCGLFNGCVIHVDTGRIIGVILVLIGAGLVLGRKK